MRIRMHFTVLDVIILTILMLLSGLRSFNASFLGLIIEDAKSGNSVLSKALFYGFNEITIIVLLVVFEIVKNRAITNKRKHLKVGYIKNNVADDNINSEKLDDIYNSQIKEISYYVENRFERLYNFAYCCATLVFGIVALGIQSISIAIFEMIAVAISTTILIKSEEKIKKTSTSFTESTKAFTVFQKELFEGHNTIIAYSPYKYISTRIKKAVISFEQARYILKNRKNYISDLSYLPVMGMYYLIIVLILLVVPKEKQIVMMITFLSLEGWISSSAECAYNEFVSIKSVDELKEKYCKDSKVHKTKKYKLNEITEIQIRDYVLKNNQKSTFTLKKNQKYLLTGENGIGKSTLVKKFVCESDLKDEDILINGVKIKNCDADSILQNIGYADSNEYIFDASLLFNLCLTETCDNPDFLIKLADLVSLDLTEKNDIKEFSDKKIKESGSNISGGQRQKINLIRTLYQNKSVLILDEAMRNIDYHTRKKLYDYILKMEKLVIIIDHNFDQKLYPSVIEVHIP